MTPNKNLVEKSEEYQCKLQMEISWGQNKGFYINFRKANTLHTHLVDFLGPPETIRDVF